MGGGPDIDAVFEIEEELENEDVARQSKFRSPAQQAQFEARRQSRADIDKLGVVEHEEHEESALTTSGTPEDQPPGTPKTPAEVFPPRSHTPHRSLPIGTPPSPGHASETGLSINISHTSSPQHYVSQPLSARPRRRSRLYSQMTRPTDLMAPPVVHSPLTQLFQPLMVDIDPFSEHVAEPDIPEDEPLTSGLHVPGGVPGGRHRLSMHRRNVTEPMGINPLVGGPAGGQPRRPPMPRSSNHVQHGANQQTEVPPGSSLPFSESPQVDMNHWPSRRGEERFSRGDFSEFGDAGPSVVGERLRAIEERQARIEDLLLRLVGSTSANGTAGTR